MGDAAPQAAGYAQMAYDLGVTLTLDALRKVFPDWRIWEAGGKVFASRPGTVTASGPQSLIRPVVIATNVLGLADQLEMQGVFRRMSDAELESVWRDGIGAYVPDADEPPAAGQ